jgi:hypothetical protein
MTTSALVRSMFIHSLLLFVIGCVVHKPVTVHEVDPLVKEGQEYVMALSAKMPEWEKDTHYVIYERVELATVEADIEVAKRATGEIEFLKDVSKLREDWNKLVALDDLLRHTSLT